MAHWIIRRCAYGDGAELDEGLGAARPNHYGARLRWQWVPLCDSIQFVRELDAEVVAQLVMPGAPVRIKEVSP